jgi:hypothetical protein
MGNRCYNVPHDLKAELDWDNEILVRKKTFQNSVRNAGLGKEMWVNKALFLQRIDSTKKLQRRQSRTSLQGSKVKSLKRSCNLTFADDLEQIFLIDSEFQLNDLTGSDSETCNEATSYGPASSCSIEQTGHLTGNPNMGLLPSVGCYYHPDRLCSPTAESHGPQCGSNSVSA